ncbi:MAG: LysR family transcriptional regulator [Chromatiaceae bacterium]|nr:LysR family transcriptional regulator [Chromatiaceae bacterium]
MGDRRLQVFHAVARFLSFTKAAEALHMTQPAVTFQVRQLEEQFNTRLFDRSRNRIRLTEAGHIVFDAAERIFAIQAEMERAVRALTGELNTTLCLGASTTIAEYLLPPLLGAFRERYPEVGIQLKVSNTEGVVSLAESNAIDLGLVEGPVASRNLEVEPCTRDQLLAIVHPAHPLAQFRTVTPARLLEYPFICREAGSGTREVLLEYLHAQAPALDAPRPLMELGSPEAVKGAVEAGLGVSVVSAATLRKELRLGSLVALTLNPTLERTFYFVHRTQKFRPRIVEELLTFAHAYLRDEAT